MHQPFAQPLSPSLSALLAAYDCLEPAYLRAVVEEDRLLTIFERDKPCGENEIAAFREQLGLDKVTQDGDRLGGDLAGVAKQILTAEPTGWSDIMAIAGLIRRRNPPDVDGSTVGFYGDTVDFPRHIERLGVAVAQAEAADAALVEMVARYKEVCAADESRPESERSSEASADALFDTIASWCPATLRGLAAVAKTARLRDSDTLRETVLMHVERLAGLPEASMQVRDAGMEAA